MYQQIVPVYARAFEVFRANLPGFVLLAVVVTLLDFVIDFSTGATLVVWIGIALIAHRAILLGDGIALWRGSEDQPAPRYVAFLLAFIGFVLVLFVSSIAIAVAFKDILRGIPSFLVLLPASVLYGLALARLGIVLPAFAVGDQRPGDEIMAMGRGQTGRTFLRLIGGSLLATICILVVLGALAALLIAIFDPAAMVRAAIGILAWLGGIFTTTLVASALSLGYLEALGRAAPPEPGSDGQP
ncbi:MAG: hypothetical protein AAF919_15930 [Pseudomonadota bacterium]